MESISLQEIAAGTEPDLRLHNVEPEAAWQMLRARGRYRFVVGGNPHVNLPSYEVPFLPASALRINEALLVAAADGYVPFTDSAVHDKLLRVKALNARGSKVDSERLGIAELASEQADLASLSWLVLDKLVSAEQLAHYSMEHVLRYRALNQALLSRLRRTLSKLSDELAAITDLRPADRKLDQIIDRKMLAEVEKAQQEVADSWRDFVAATLLRSARWASPAIVVSVLAGLDLAGIVLAAAGAGAAALGSESVKDAITMMQVRRKALRHDYSYLTRL